MLIWNYSLYHQNDRYLNTCLNSRAIGNLNVSKISLTGVSEALAKHAKEGAESKGIKAHFAMDESGILNLAQVELISEKVVTVEEKKVEEGAFSKLGSTISKLFSGLFSAIMLMTRDEQGYFNFLFCMLILYTLLHE